MFIQVKRLLFLVTATIVFAGNSLAQQKKAIGWVEKIGIPELGVTVNGTLLSGAEICSLNSSDIQYFKRDGQDWVRFKVLNRYGPSIQAEKPVIRFASIKSKSGPAEKRPVVRFGLCIGTHFAQTEISLTNRKKFSYDMLIGRGFEAGHFLIDPSVTYTQEPSCPGKAKLALTAPVQNAAKPAGKVK